MKTTKADRHGGVARTSNQREPLRGVIELSSFCRKVPPTATGCLTNLEDRSQ
jgi:hypothetical protein